MSLASRINKLSKSKDFGEAFVEAMDLAIQCQNKPRQSRPNIKPSKASCLRMMYYILTSAEVDGASTINPDMALIQQEGSAMHNVIQEILVNAKGQGIEFMEPAKEVDRAKALGINTEVRRSEHDGLTPYEVTCYNSDYDISFKFDGVIVFMNARVIFELKNEDHFKWMKRFGPEEDHIMQATFYSICLGIDKVLLVYVGRNYKKRKAYLVEITDEQREHQINRINMAKECAKSKTLPCAEKGKHCKYCSYTKLCKSAI